MEANVFLQLLLLIVVTLKDITRLLNRARRFCSGTETPSDPPCSACSSKPVVVPIITSSHLVSDHLVLLCSWAFLSPCLLRILSFLFPLIATTFALHLLTLLITSPADGGVLDRLRVQSDRERGVSSDDHGHGAGGYPQELHMVLFHACETQSEKATEVRESVALASDPTRSCSQQHATGISDSSEIKDQQGGGKTATGKEARTVSCVQGSGWMEKEQWMRNSLAYKILEERQNSGDEGMDSLWEAYEAESKKRDSNMKKLVELEASMKRNSRPAEKGKKKKKTAKKHQKYGPYGKGNGVGDNDDDGFGEVCCLQALKGIGWLHAWGTMPRFNSISHFK